MEKIVDSERFRAYNGEGKKLFEEIEKKPQTIIADPPYNRNKDYGCVSDNLDKDSYRKMIGETLDVAYDNSAEDASFFLIHYQEDVAEMYDIITNKWCVHQWITWCYPSNYGHSTKKFTNASRVVLWLKKEEDPKFKPKEVVQKYKNPSDSRIKKKIEDGRLGAHLYDWLEINHVKNVSEEYQGYDNQIPEKLLKILILTTTDKGELIADPFSGSYSTARTALKHGRLAVGSDLNKGTNEYAKKIDISRIFDSGEETPILIDGEGYDETQ